MNGAPTYVLATGQGNPLAPSHTGARFLPVTAQRGAYVCTSTTADEARAILAVLRGMATPAERAAVASVRDDADPYADGGRL